MATPFVKGPFLKGSLLAREVSKPATAATTATVAATTTSISTSTTTSISTSTSTSVAATSSATTSAATAGAATSILSRGAVVQTHGSSRELAALHVAKRGACLVNRGELDVSESLGPAGLLVGGQTNAGDRAVVGEQVVDHLLVGAERDVADEKSVALRAGLVAEGFGTAKSFVHRTTSVVSWAGIREVDVDGTSVDFNTLLRGMRFSSIPGIGKLDVAEPVTNK